ncbi:MAG: DNA/RNA helicase domain-containing protein, partial [Phycisphaerales bacterium]
VKDYVERYSSKPHLVPPEHVLVFDEAQRAYDRSMVAEKHRIPLAEAKSEPELFIEFAERIPEWCVVVGLIGGGQEIHKGEEAGVVQWRHAIEASSNRSAWCVHLPPRVAGTFDGMSRPVVADPRLSLDTELRFHLTTDVHRFVAQLLDGCPAPENASLLRSLESSGFHIRMTRDLEVAKRYLQDRYRDQPDARFGLLASSRDRMLKRFRVYNDFQSTKVVRFGPWYGDAENDPSGRSCRLLQDCVTEFGAQGLELDAALVAWGSDFRMQAGRWDSSQAARYQSSVATVRDSHQLRLNSYRVLLTRGREASVLFVPPAPEMNETASYLADSGVLLL